MRRGTALITSRVSNDTQYHRRLHRAFYRDRRELLSSERHSLSTDRVFGMRTGSRSFPVPAAQWPPGRIAHDHRHFRYQSTREQHHQDRRGSPSKVCDEAGEEVELLDLTELPVELFDGASYGEKPAAFAPFQDAILATDGILTVIPEYNGACPGVMKYFIDMLRFPDSLYEKPVGFIGLSAGPWGAVRAVEQLEMVFQYRHAHLFGRRVFIPTCRQGHRRRWSVRRRGDGEALRRGAREVRRFLQSPEGLTILSRGLECLRAL